MINGVTDTREADGGIIVYTALWGVPQEHSAGQVLFDKRLDHLNVERRDYARLDTSHAGFGRSDILYLIPGFRL